jgi:flagellar basal-body rod modification protein FlgD
MSDIDTKNLYNQLGINKADTSKAKANDELGQTEFLELMTAQLRFQDPLAPMENGEFLAQMAQFGTVSGINDLNASFNSMSAGLQGNQALQASTMVGRNVLVPGNDAVLGTEGGIHAAVELEQAASKVIINVEDNLGQLVHRIDLGRQQPGLHEFEWNGINSDGTRVSAGSYNITAEVHQGNEISAGEMLTTVQVESVTLGQGGQDLTLTVSGLGDISMSQIRKIM